jgi:glycosyltransferase 2 family protein
VIGATPVGFEAALVDLQESFPHFLEPLWQIGYELIGVWAVFLLLAAVLRRRWRLLIDLVMAAVAAALLGLLVARLAGADWPSLDEVLTPAGVTSYPALRLSVAVAITSAASPHLSRPLRYLGRWIVFSAVVSGFFLLVCRPWGLPAGLAIGIGVAAALHLIFGSPGGRPTMKEVRRALADIGVDAEPTGEAGFRGAGVSVVGAVSSDGTPLLLKVYGRDAWDGQRIATVWRVLWYRGTDVNLTFSRLQQVEHEAFLTLLAERRGAPVTPVVAAGRSASGDALLAVQVPGTPLAGLDPASVEDWLLKALWDALRNLHGAGVAHGRIDPDRIVIDDAAQPHFADFGAAQVVTDVEPILADRAQMLVTTALLVGVERATKVAIGALEPEGVAEITPYLQPAALSSGLRERVDGADLDLDDLRKQAAAAVDTHIPELAKLRRITWGSVLLAVFLFIAGYFLISGLANIGWDNIVEAVKSASLPILFVALVMGQTPRVTQSFSVMAVSPTPLPLGRVTGLQFATTFVNLAMPSTAGRVAVNIRFFQCAGASPGTAVAVGALDGLAGFVVQVGLMASILLLGLGSLDIDLSNATTSDSGLGKLLIILAIVAVLAGVLLVVVRPLRERVLSALRDIWATAHSLRSPRSVLQLLLANLVTELLFALTMWTVLHAYNQSVSLPNVILINEGVALFAGFMPVPGGIGVTESALTAGFVAAGVPDATAFAAALSYRLVTFYLPPIWGFFAFRWLQRRHYL